jgi:hypothetical protein
MGFIISLKYEDGRSKEILNLSLPKFLLPLYWKMKESLGQYCPTLEERDAILRSQKTHSKPKDDRRKASSNSLDNT